MSFRIGALLMSCLALTACATSSIRPIAGSPPYSKMEVVSPFSWGENSLIFITVNYPKGIYLPAFEDDNGYYYQAPQKLTGSDSGMGMLLEGGIYLEKEKSKPDKTYFLRVSNGVPAIKKMEKPEDIRLIP